MSLVRCLRYMAEEADLDDPREHLDASQKPISGESGAVSHPFESRAAARTVCGFFMISSGKGASMRKLPLSEAPGPAFAFAIRSDALGEADEVQVLQDLRVRERHDLDGNPLRELLKVSEVLSNRRRWQFLRWFPVQLSSCGSRRRG